MSLYTILSQPDNNGTKMPVGMTVAPSANVALLSTLANATTEEIASRLSNGNHAFVAYINDMPAAFGWMAMHHAKIGELNHEFDLPAGSRYLWNFRTLEAFRGLGIYPALLQYIVINEARYAERFWIIHAPENKPSLNGINKAGFEFVGKLYVGTNGETTIEANTNTLRFHEELGYMGIKLSDHTPNSCWNCSSPYLKKRSSECCCKKQEAECIGNTMAA